MAGKTFNVGVIGYGMSAKVFHIPFINSTPQFNLYGIVQRTPQDDNSAPKDYPNLKHYTDAKVLIADPDVDVIVITTPPASHFDLTKTALEAGKHVLTEKPFVPTASEADQLAAAATAANRLLCVFQNRRWDDDFLTVKRVLADDTLGRVLEFNTHFDRYRSAGPRSWKATLDMSAGGSAVYDLGTHLVDQVYVLFGMPQAVHGRLLNQHSGSHDFVNPDAVSAELTYPDGKLVHVRISAMSAEVTQPRFWIRGTKGSLHAFGLDPQEDQLKAGQRPGDKGFGKRDSNTMRINVVGNNDAIKEGTVPSVEPETYTAFYEAFGKAVESGKGEDVPVKAEEASNVLRIIEAIQTSARTGKDVIFA